ITGVGPALVVTAGCFLLGIVGMVLIRGVRATPSQGRRSPIREIVEGIDYTRSTPGVSRVIGLTLVFGLSSLAFIQMASGFARAGLGLLAPQPGLFMLRLGLGAILGGAIFRSLQVRGTLGLCILAMSAYAGTLVLFAINPWTAGMYVIALLNGVAN